MKNLTYQNTKQLYEITVQTHKSDSAFLYFTLEASEGLCFYSTLQHEQGDEARNILIRTPIESKTELIRFLKALEDKVELKTLKEQVIFDSVDHNSHLA